MAMFGDNGRKHTTVWSPQICDYLDVNEDSFRDFQTEAETDNHDHVDNMEVADTTRWAPYVESMQILGTFGGDIELKAASDHFRSVWL